MLAFNASTVIYFGEKNKVEIELKMFEVDLRSILVCVLSKSNYLFLIDIVYDCDDNSF